MTISHHPDVATLVTCSAGAQPEVLCAVVASHISLCPDCHAEFTRMDAIGTTLFADLAPQPLDAAVEPPDCAPTAAEIRTEAAHAVARDSEIPATLVPVLGADLDSLDWQPLRPGVDHHVIRLSSAATGDLRLVRLAPGAALAEHGHLGEELTLVLRGAYRDGEAVFRTGDFSDLDDETRHQPAATADGECILLIASEEPPEFAARAG